MPRVQAPRELGAVVRGRREDLGWSQAELARRAGVSRWWVGQLENGRPGAPLDLVLRTLGTLRLVVEVLPSTATRTEPHTGPKTSVDLDALLDAYTRDEGAP